MEIKWNQACGQAVEMDVKEQNGVVWLSFPALEKTGIVINGFSTRHGGVSRGCYTSMNLSFSRDDEESAVMENYRRMAETLGVSVDSMVLSWQTHTVNVRRITEADKGKGIIKERDYQDVDGLITDIPGITLVTFYADCVPLYFLDPKRKAIGLSHSGWRGTVRRMGAVTLKEMEKAYGTRAEDVIACIGPSICRSCFEVGEEVIEEVKKAFGPQGAESLFCAGKRSGKYQLDLWEANKKVLEEAGVKPANIHTAGICTMCNPDHLYSHRVMGNHRGNLAAFLSLRE